MSTEERVNKIISENLMLESEMIRPEELLADLGADSLDLVEIVMKVENEFGIAIPDMEMENFLRVQDIYDYLNTNVKK